VYGVLYGSASDSRWHECGHGTACKTRWLDHGVYHLASLCMMREPTVWRWQHTRHHTETIIDEATFIPVEERRKVYRTSRLWLAIYAGTAAAAAVSHSWFPLVLIGGPRIYGAFMHLPYGLTQHAGLGENVLDRRPRAASLCPGLELP
jgi:fatty acid desaturase